MLLACGPAPTASPTSTPADPTPTDTAWSPGDPVPGWEDADCGWVFDGSGVKILHPDVPRARVEHVPATATQPAALRFTVLDCMGAACPPDAPTRMLKGFTLELTATGADTTSALGLGEYGPADDLSATPRAAVLHLESVLTAISTYDDKIAAGAMRATAKACVRRNRPDGLIVDVDLAVAAADARLPLYPREYPAVHIVLPFEVRYADHAGYVVSAGAKEGCSDQVAHVYDGISYDDAWPWASITDASVREKVYTRYTPCNAM
jgi:hypothetical protein